MEKYLCHNDLLSSEEGSKVFIKVHLLLVADGVVADPQLLRVCFKSDVDEAEGEEDEDGEGANNHHSTVIVIEPT